MKVAVLSDIHGNLPALRTVSADIDQWRPDIVVVGGDIVNRGPRSGACLDYVLERQAADGWNLIRGNHEEFVLACRDETADPTDPVYQMTQFAHFALNQLNGNAAILRELPDLYEWLPVDNTAQDEHRQALRVVHASMGSNRDGVYPETSDEHLRAQIDPAPAIFATGHTHRPLIRRLDNSIVINVGSVGSPFDSDRRAGYGRLELAAEGWSAEVRRIEYDYTQIETDYVESGFLLDGGPLAQLMLVELRKAHGLIFRWASRYERAVLEGKMTLEASVRAVLSDPDVRAYTGAPGWVI
jgi:predicted phosphodiesterase